MRILIIIISLFISSSLLSQANDSINQVKYTNDFKFKDGLYLNFNQLKNNAPLLKSRIVSKYDYSRSDFYDLILQNKVVSYYDNNGVKQSFAASNVWGYSKNGVLFVRVDNEFNRVTIVGAICHFVAVVTSYNAQYYDPYRYGGSYSYQTVPVSAASKEMRQYVIDFKTGNILDYNVESMEALLMHDTELYDEFISLKKKDKKKLKFLYIRKFNDRNPIYLPI